MKFKKYNAQVMSTPSYYSLSEAQLDSRWDPSCRCVKKMLQSFVMSVAMIAVFWCLNKYYHRKPNTIAFYSSACYIRLTSKLNWVLPLLFTVKGLSSLELFSWQNVWFSRLLSSSFIHYKHDCKIDTLLMILTD